MISQKKQSRALTIGLCALLFLFVCGISFLRITESVTVNSDDYAAYLNEAISIAEDDSENGYRRNAIMHTGRDGGSGKLVYSWGYPLMLSAVYRLVGWNSTAPELIVFYKLPAVLCLGLTGVVLLLFFRRRFSLLPALLLALLSCIAPYMMNESNRIQNDIPGLLFSGLSLLFTECYANTLQSETRRRYLLAFFCALSYFGVTQIRLNGIGAVLACGVCLVMNAPLKGQTLRQNTFRVALPLLLFGILYFVSGLIIPQSTSNIGDIGKISLSNIGHNIVYYYRCAKDALIGVLLPFIKVERLPLLLAGIGVVLGFFKRRDAYMSLFVAGSFVVLCLLDYHQGFRYIMPVFPLLLMFAGLALQAGYRMLQKRITSVSVQKAMRVLLPIFVSLYLVAFGGMTAKGSCEIYQYRDLAREQTNSFYGPEARALYTYIRDNVPSTDVIVNNRPRALCLNTGRLCSLSFTPLKEWVPPAAASSNGLPGWLVVYTPEYWEYGPTFSSCGADWEGFRVTPVLRYQNSVYEVYQLPNAS